MTRADAVHFAADSTRWLRRKEGTGVKHLIILAGAVLAVGALAVSASGCRKQSQSATASRAPTPKDGQSSNLAEELHVLLAQNRDTVLNISHSVIAKTDLIQVAYCPKQVGETLQLQVCHEFWRPPQPVSQMPKDDILQTLGIPTPDDWTMQQFDPGCVILFSLPKASTEHIPAFVGDVFAKLYKQPGVDKYDISWERL